MSTKSSPATSDTKFFGPRGRKVRILVTLGPSSSSPEQIAALFHAGADAFRINMSHGEQADKKALVQHIRALENETGRPTTILADLQGPKLRIGTFKNDKAELKTGAKFILDRNADLPGDETRVALPHKEIFAAVQPGENLLINDGQIALEVLAVEEDKITTRVEVGGIISNRKGVNVPGTLLPIAALTEKDRSDLAFMLDQGVDWIALSFVQRPEDVAEARKLVAGRAAVLSKIEKPQAIQQLAEIIDLSDAVMVARGDLGVEMPPEKLPAIQKEIIHQARIKGRPVVVATQMLESMIETPVPTRAEVSDVATAIYDGADAVMLSAETAAGKWPVKAVEMMDRIGRTVENDSAYYDRVHYVKTAPDPTTADALSMASERITRTIRTASIVCFTSSGSTARRVARERPEAPVMVLTPNLSTARRLGLLWGVHAVQTKDIGSFEEMVGKGKRMALRQGVAKAGERLIILAGVPFGTPGSTNVLHVVTLTGKELEGN